MPYGYTPLTALDAMAECFELPLLAAATAVALAVSPCARRHPPAHGLHTTGWEAVNCPGFAWMSVDQKVLRAPHPQLQYAWRGRHNFGTDWVMPGVRLRAARGAVRRGCAGAAAMILLGWRALPNALSPHPPLRAQMSAARRACGRAELELRRRCIGCRSGGAAPRAKGFVWAQVAWRRCGAAALVYLRAERSPPALAPAGPG